jgi:hypothetical protein
MFHTCDTPNTRKNMKCVCRSGAIRTSSLCKPQPYHCHLLDVQGTMRICVFQTRAICGRYKLHTALLRFSFRHRYIHMLPIACLRLFSILSVTTTHKPCIPTWACFYTPTTYTSHLSPVKQYVYELNNIILPNLQSDSATYKSVDTVVWADGAVNYPTYFIHALSVWEQEWDREQGLEREREQPQRRVAGYS